MAAFSPYFAQLKLPQPNSHKGQNGKLLIIGGSELFHAASKWSLDIASHFVDMVFYASVPSNNELVQQSKGQFWNGIVIERGAIEEYIQEADCILIGPGMTRTRDTYDTTNNLAAKYPQKKWVIDAGALQMIEPELLNERMIITPHSQEFFDVYRRMARTYLKPSRYSANELEVIIGGETVEYNQELSQEIKDNPEFPLLYESDIRQYMSELYDNTLTASSTKKMKNYLLHASKGLNRSLVLLKGHSDLVFQFNGDYDQSQFEVIAGGNPGMTKGGTGDVLAGLVAALYCTNDAMVAAVVGSVVSKTAGDELAKTMGPFFNASELVGKIPETIWDLMKN